MPRTLLTLLPLLLLSSVLEAKMRAVSSRITPVVREIARVPTPVAALAEAPDGLLFAGRDVGVLGADGGISIIARGVFATSVAAGPGGNSYWMTTSPGPIVRLAEGRLESFPVNGAPHGIVAGSDGNFWFIRIGGIGRITPDGTVHELATPAELGTPVAVIRGIDGAMLVAGHRAVARVVADGVYDVLPTTQWFVRRMPSTGFSGMAQTPDGAIWFGIPTEARTSGFATGGAIVHTTTRFEAASGLQLAFFCSPVHLTPAPDGSLWFVEENFFYAPLFIERTLVGRRPNGSVERYPLGTGSTALMVDRAGAVWIAVNDAEGRSATIARLQPR
ncbi:MAG TPA: hypothetical protein VEO54_32865 [Thermoanaerobaculia bacterium]|nr:hypothetical protein [Thermoanaerobaculia bacterium]